MSYLNKTMLIEMYLNQKMSIPEIAEATKCSRTNVRYHLIRNGVTLRTRKEWTEIARPKFAKHLKGTTRIVKEETKKKLRAAAQKRFEGIAKGVYVHNGYRCITIGENCGRLEHVVIMEQHIGRKLNKGEVVHHINGDKLDNRIENLLLMNEREHHSLHSKQYVKSGKCYDISQHAKKGEEHPHAKLNWEKVNYIRSSDKKNKDLSKMFNVSVSVIKSVKSYKTWRK